MDMASKAKRFDLEAVEGALRAAVLTAGAKILEELIVGIGCGRREDSVVCRCGSVMQSKGIEHKTIVTIMGAVSYGRSRYECALCGETGYPGDEDLDIVGTTRAPGVRRMTARAGSRQPFKESQQDLKVYAGIHLSAKDVERMAERVGEQTEVWQTEERQQLLCKEVPLNPIKSIPVLYIGMDGTGVPMVKADLQGRKGKQPDGTAKTREAKLGCVFTQTKLDDDGRPVRDAESTTFVGAIETAENFGTAIYAEAIRRGLYNAHRVVVLGDGAVWIRGLTELHFPDAIQIVDLYHAREHVSNLSKLLFSSNEHKITYYRNRWWNYLDEGLIEQIIREAKKKPSCNKDILQKVESEIHYLQENKDRMRYADFRKQRLFVGSGVVEAGCKTVIGARLKQSGMEWSVRGANSIISLRCVMLSNRFEDFWESRAA